MHQEICSKCAEPLPTIAKYCRRCGNVKSPVNSELTPTVIWKSGKEFDVEVDHVLGIDWVKGTTIRVSKIDNDAVTGSFRVMSYPAQHFELAIGQFSAACQIRGNAMCRLLLLDVDSEAEEATFCLQSSGDESTDTLEGSVHGCAVFLGILVQLCTIIYAIYWSFPLSHPGLSGVLVVALILQLLLFVAGLSDDVKRDNQSVSSIKAPREELVNPQPVSSSALSHGANSIRVT